MPVVLLVDNYVTDHNNFLADNNDAADNDNLIADDDHFSDLFMYITMYASLAALFGRTPLA